MRTRCRGDADASYRLYSHLCPAVRCGTGWCRRARASSSRSAAAATAASPGCQTRSRQPATRRIAARFPAIRRANRGRVISDAVARPRGYDHGRAKLRAVGLYVYRRTVTCSDRRCWSSAERSLSTNRSNAFLSLLGSWGRTSWGRAEVVLPRREAIAANRVRPQKAEITARLRDYRDLLLGGGAF